MSSIEFKSVESLRKEFPQLSAIVYGKELVYLDNAATSQRPQSVVDKWNDVTLHHNANLHRAVHHLADIATRDYEAARDFVKDFIGACCREEIIFTSGATASVNLVAYSFGEKFISEGDEIIVSEAEHHSNIVPWQLLCKRKNAILKVLHVDDNGCLKLEELKTLVTERTKLLCVAHISNVLGIINPVEDIIKCCHSKGCKVLIDGAQGIVHVPTDVRKMDCDFYLFSGHKVYAAPGTGVLYAKKDILEAMPPFMGGGEMIANVGWEETTYAPLPYKFEAGTQNIAGTPTLVPALETALAIRSQEIENQYNELKELVYDRLMSDPRIRLYGQTPDPDKKIALFSFSVEQLHHEDLALLLDKMGIAVRSGQMCAEPLMNRFGVTGMLRASFAPYNTVAEAEYFLRSLNRAIDMLV